MCARRQPRLLAVILFCFLPPALVSVETPHTAMDPGDQYTVQLITPEETDDVTKFLKRTFYVDEPLNHAVGLCTGTDECPELEEYCTRALPDRLSLKAVDSRGDIVGTMINGVVPLKQEENGNDLQSQAERCKNPKFQKILYILAKREEGARLWERFPDEEQMVEVLVAATDPKWRRKGIMNTLLNKTQQLILQRGVKLLRIDTSSAYSAKSAEHLGFTCVYRARYEDIKHNGHAIIVPEPPHVDDRVYVKQL